MTIRFFRVRELEAVNFRKSPRTNLDLLTEAAATIVSVYPAEQEIALGSQKTDAESLGSDWNRVGQQMNLAIDNFNVGR